jgi:hypothetical protein
LNSQRRGFSGAHRPAGTREYVLCGRPQFALTIPQALDGPPVADNVFIMFGPKTVDARDQSYRPSLDLSALRSRGHSV